MPLDGCRLVALDGEMARAEPKRLRYCLLHAAGVHGPDDAPGRASLPVGRGRTTSSAHSAASNTFRLRT